LLRATLLRLAEDEYIGLFTMHHIVSDGWSMGVLIKEVAALYEGFSNDRPSTLPGLGIPYADYACLQRQRVQGEVLVRRLFSWRQQLGGAPPALELPTDRPRPAVSSYRGGSEPFTVEQSVARSLSRLSRDEGVTLFITLLAAYQTLLYRYSGQEEVVVG